VLAVLETLQNRTSPWGVNSRSRSVVILTVAAAYLGVRGGDLRLLGFRVRFLLLNSLTQLVL
jgi:hypothetical protein